MAHGAMQIAAERMRRLVKRPVLARAGRAKSRPPAPAKNRLEIALERRLDRDLKGTWRRPEIDVRQGIARMRGHVAPARLLC